MILVRKKFYIVIFLISIDINMCNGNCYGGELCKIRFYDRKHFRGSHWTLDSRGRWISSRRSALSLPYWHFQTKSIRLFCSNSCKWQICPIRTRRNARIPRRKRCRILTGDVSLRSLRLWGWPNYILGHVYKMPNKRGRARDLQNDSKYAITHHLPKNATSTNNDIPLYAKPTTLPENTISNGIFTEQKIPTYFQTGNSISKGNFRKNNK